MSLNHLLYYYLIWGFAGIILFSIYIVMLFQTGLVYEGRTKKGSMRINLSAKGILLVLVLLVGTILMQCLSVFFNIKPYHPGISFQYLLLLNFILFLLYLVYNTLIIDFLVICIWRPGFLKIPLTMNFSGMKKHIFLSLPIGTVIGFGISFISAVFCKYLILQ